MRTPLPPLTGTRFLAAAIVMIYHGSQVLGPTVLLDSLAGPAVSFFFVLSGFILQHNYSAALRGYSLRTFYVARIARIWPLHLFMLFIWLWLISGQGKLTSSAVTAHPEALMANALLLHAWVPDLSWNLSFNAVSWSLSVEAFFYLCFPFIMSPLQRNPWRGLAMLASLVTIMLWYDSMHPINASASLLTQFNPCARLLEFALGMATATMVRRHASGESADPGSLWTLIELVAVGTLVIVVMQLNAAIGRIGVNSAVGHYLGISGLALPLCLMIALFSRSTGVIARALSTSALQFLGNASFALYLCHLIILHYMAPYQGDLARLGVTPLLAYVACCIVIAGLSYIGVEEPLRRLVIRAGSREPLPALAQHKSSWPAAWSCLAIMLIFTGMAKLPPNSIRAVLAAIPSETPAAHTN